MDNQKRGKKAGWILLRTVFNGRYQWMLAIFLLVFVGCASQKTVKPPLRCIDALADSYGGVSDSEIANFLDESFNNGTRQTCWEPLIKKSLDERRDIPHEHVKLAVKHFNQLQHKDYFHKAVYRYFRDIIDQNATYRQDQDRAFLEEYCRYAIKRATTKSDKILIQARLLCEQVDPWLFNRIFQ